MMAKICLFSDRLAISKEVISLILTFQVQKWKYFLSETLSSSLSNPELKDFVFIVRAKTIYQFARQGQQHVAFLGF